LIPSSKILYKTKVFQPLESSKWRNRNFIIKIVGVAILLLLALVTYNESYYSSIWVQIGGIILFLTWLTLFLMKFEINYTSREDGKDLIFRYDEIQIGHEKISVLELAKFDLTLNDFQGKLEYRRLNDFTPMKSQGFGNEIRFETKNNKKYGCKFQLKAEDAKLKIEPFVYKLVQLNILNRGTSAKIFNFEKEKEREMYIERLDKYLKINK
jgi:hypothetical protein